MELNRQTLRKIILKEIRESLLVESINDVKAKNKNISYNENEYIVKAKAIGPFYKRLPIINVKPVGSVLSVTVDHPLDGETTGEITNQGELKELLSGLAKGKDFYYSKLKDKDNNFVKLYFQKV